MIMIMITPTLLITSHLLPVQRHHWISRDRRFLQPGHFLKLFFFVWISQFVSSLLLLQLSQTLYTRLVLFVCHQHLGLKLYKIAWQYPQGWKSHDLKSFPLSITNSQTGEQDNRHTAQDMWTEGFCMKLVNTDKCFAGKPNGSPSLSDVHFHRLLVPNDLQRRLLNKSILHLQVHQLHEHLHHLILFYPITYNICV